MPRLLHLSLSTFYFLLFTLFALTPTSLRAESSLYIKPDDDQVRATERLSDFLDDLGYSVEYADADKDLLIVHQQGHNIRASILFIENQYKILKLCIGYKFNPKAGTAVERALAANQLNDEQAALKVCVDEEGGGYYFEYALPFSGFLRPCEVKRFADEAVARSYHLTMKHKAFRKAFYVNDDDDSADADPDGDADATDKSEVLRLDPDEDNRRSTLRLGDFLSAHGYSVKAAGPDDAIVITQQGRELIARLRVNRGNMALLCLQTQYKFKPEDSTSLARLEAVNHFNDTEPTGKLSINEAGQVAKLDFVIPLDNTVTLDTLKRYIDAFAEGCAWAERDDEDIHIILGKAKQSTKDNEATPPSPSSSSVPISPPSSSAPAAPEPPSPRDPVPPSSSSPSSSLVPVSPPSSSAPAAPSLIPELPPTTPASPAPSKKTRA